MGMELDLLPLEDRSGGPGAASSYTVLPVGKEYDLHDRIKALHQEECPKDTWTYLGRDPDGRYKSTAFGPMPPRDNYGDPLRWVRAGDLARAYRETSDARGGEDECSDRFLATQAFLERCHPALRIALHWH